MCFSLTVVNALWLVACSPSDGPPAPSNRTVAAYSLPENAMNPASCVISDSSVGPVRLGMTVRDAESAWPAAAFSRTSDGEGVALIEVKVGGEAMMTIYAGEDGSNPALDKARPIEHIETFSNACGTAQGIRPGMLISDAENILGKVTMISKSEIESREFVDFANKAGSLTIRIDYTGIFGPDSAETTRFAPEAKILSIAIASRG